MKRLLHTLFQLLAPSAWTQGIMRHAAVLASGHAIAMACGLAAAPLLCRLYTPESFGILAVFNLLTVLAIFIGTLRFENAIPLPRSHIAATALTTVGLLAAVALSIVLAIATVTCSGIWRATIPRWSELTVIWPLGAAVLTVAAFQILTGWCVRGGRFSALSQMRVVQVLTSIAVQIAFPCVWAADTYGLILGQIIGFGAAALWGTWRLRHTLRVPVRLNVRFLTAVALRYGKYPAFDIPASLFSCIPNHGAPALIAVLYGAPAAGCLALAHKLLAAPLNMLGQAVSRAFYNQAIDYSLRDAAELRQLFRKTVLQILLLTAVPVTLIAAIAPFTFGAAFGDEWQKSGILIGLLAPMVTSSILVSAISPTLDVLKRLDLRLLREAACAVLILLGMLIAHVGDWSDTWAVATASLLATVGQLFSLWVVWITLDQPVPVQESPLRAPRRSRAA